MAVFPGKGQTNSPCPPLSFSSRLISPKPDIKKPLLFLSIPCHSHIGRTVNCTEYLPGFPWAWSPWGVSAGSRDRRPFDGPNRSWLEVSPQAQNVTLNLWFYTTVLLSRNHSAQVHACGSSAPDSVLSKLLFLSFVYAGVSGHRCHLAWSGQGASMGAAGIGTRAQHVSPESRDLTVCVGLHWLLLSYFIISTHK